MKTFTASTIVKLFRATAMAAAFGLAAAPATAADKAIGIDWATYNPLSLIIKSKGWMEQEFAKDGVEVKWVQSAGSNLAIGSLNSKAVDFGSTAGAAALMGRINGGEFKSVYVFSKPEWTALVTRKDSAIKSIADLKDKRIAAARGTDPHVFLIRALKGGGLSAKDAKVVLLQHDAGMRALEAGEVDAWAGLDPLMAQAELKGNRLFFRNADLNTYGVLNVREEFAKNNPELVSRVLKVYETARKWAKDNPGELKAAMVAATGLPEDVIAKQLERTDLSNGAVGAAQRAAILGAGQALQEAGVIPGDVDVAKMVDATLDAKFFKPTM